MDLSKSGRSQDLLQASTAAGVCGAGPPQPVGSRGKRDIVNTWPSPGGGGGAVNTWLRPGRGATVNASLSPGKGVAVNT